jgi:hypothetical protein
MCYLLRPTSSLSFLTFQRSFRTHRPNAVSNRLTMIPGLPAITLNGGKLLVTTAFAPTTQFWPSTSSPREQKITHPYPSQELRPIVIVPPAVTPCSEIGLVISEYSWLWSMIRTEGAVRTCCSKTTRFLQDIVVLRPILHPSRSVNSGLPSLISVTIFSHTSSPR